MRVHTGIATLIVVSGSIACAAGPATAVPPSHLSAAAEVDAARQHERAAGALEKQGEHETEMIACGGIADGITSPICYSSRRPLSHGEVLASEQRQQAAEHRRVSEALRLAEERACSGIPDADRDESPFAHREDVVTVQLLPDGARVGFRAIRGLTVPWLQHVVDCHLARNDAMGHDVPSMAYCPLVPRGAIAKVSAWGDGYLIEVRSTDERGSAEIAHRAQALR